MATASVQYIFAPLTDIKSSEANKNYQDLVNFLNNQAMHRDGTVAFTGIPSGPASDPVSQNQYLRNGAVRRGIHTATGSGGDSHTGTISFSYTFAAPPIVVATVRVPVGASPYVAWTADPTTTGVAYIVAARDPGNNFASQYKIHWVAYSVLP